MREVAYLSLIFTVISSKFLFEIATSGFFLAITSFQFTGTLCSIDSDTIKFPKWYLYFSRLQVYRHFLLKSYKSLIWYTLLCSMPRLDILGLLSSLRCWLHHSTAERRSPLDGWSSFTTSDQAPAVSAQNSLLLNWRACLYDVSYSNINRFSVSITLLCATSFHFA